MLPSSALTLPAMPPLPRSPPCCALTRHAMPSPTSPLCCHVPAFLPFPFHASLNPDPILLAYTDCIIDFMWGDRLLVSL